MATIYRNGQKFAGTGSSTADKVILSSALHIGGETQTNAEDAVHALSESGGASSLADLSNVDIKNPQDGDTLYYDSINFIWTNHPLTSVTWANGTDAEIVAMLNAHYQGLIDIHDYWSVGDERIIHLNDIANVGSLNTQINYAQDVTMVLMNEGGKTLVSPINGHTECAFIVGQKDCLNKGGPMYQNNINQGGWDNIERRYWCNDSYKNAFPSSLIIIFKQHQNITGQGSTNQSATTTSNDYFAFPSEKEVFGTTSQANVTAEANNKQFKYYETSSNRIKNVNGSAGNWWGRSPCNSNSTSFCAVNASGQAVNIKSSNPIGLAPFGVI